MESIWNAQLFDFYGISDIYGACAGMCEQRRGLHLVEDDILLEVLDPLSGEPVADGKPARVLTTLTKRARPMIRFRTGDIVTADRSRCACGRTHARISITGRLDDMFIISGVNIFPSDVEHVIRNVPGLTGEYRITVYEEGHLARFELDVERAPGGQPDGDGAPVSNAALAERVVHEAKARLGVRPRRVRIVETGTLPRSTHKAKRLVDLRRRDGA